MTAGREAGPSRTPAWPVAHARARACTLAALLAVAACGSGGGYRMPPPPTVTTLDLRPRIDAGKDDGGAGALAFAHGIDAFTAAGGLRVALVRDVRTSLVTVDVRYAAGAADDPRGLAGLAHLVEHALFELRPAPGAPTVGDQLRELALYTNASTAWDETHYTTTADAAQLERVLALEGARMAATCDQLDEALLARERDVVLAEEASRASPVSELAHQLAGMVYGAGHPYARAVGSREVAAATRGDVCDFIAGHYAPSRAYLVVTGPIDVAAARAAIDRTFGAITRPALAPVTAIAAPALAGQVSRAAASVARPTAVVVFRKPPWGAPGSVPAAIGARILRRELVRADRELGWIVDSEVGVLGGPRAPVLAVALTVDDPARLAEAAEEIFSRAARLREYDEYDAIPARSSVVLEQMLRWDDLGGRGDWIADYLQYAGHDRFMVEELAGAGEGWVGHRAEVVASLDRAHARVLLLEPGGGGRARVSDARATGTHELTPWRAPVDVAEADRPLAIAAPPPPIAVEELTLAGGLRVALAPDPASPIVDVRLVFPVGTAHQPASQPALAGAAAWLLEAAEEDAGDDGHQRVKPRSTVGGAFVTDTDVDEVSTTFTVRGVAEASPRFLPELARWVQAGAYDDDIVARARAAARELDREADEDDDDRAAQEQRFRARLFGDDHPYVNVPTRYEASLRGLDVEALRAWRAQRFGPRGATLVVSGRFDATSLRAQLADRFATWTGDEPPALPAVPQARPPAGPSWLAIEAPARAQVGVRLAFAAGSDLRRDRAARIVLAEMLLDQARDVREGLGATYGLHAGYFGGVAGSALLLHGDVTEARAAAAVPTVLAAAAALRDDDGARRAAFVRARRRLLGLVQARLAGASTTARMLAAAAARGEGLADLDRLAREIAALTVADVARVAALDLDRGRLVLELRGRRAPVEAVFRALSATPAWMTPGRREPAAPPPAPAIAATATTRPRPEPAPAPPARPGPVSPWPEVDAELDAEADRVSVEEPDQAAGERQPRLFHRGARISLDRFLRVTGHGDVVTHRRRMRALRWGLVVGGAGAFAFGALDLAGGVDDHGRRNLDAALIIAGSAVAVIGLQIHAPEPTYTTLTEYADQHNRRRRPAGRAPLTIAPAIGAGGAVGLAVGGEL